MRVLIAPQEFKGSLSADEAAGAIASGIRRARPDWQLDVLPLADGGPGFIDALRRAVPADTIATAVQDPLGRRVLGRYLVLREGPTAVIEAAQANGLLHVQPEERDPLSACTFGVGELIAGALGAKPRAMIIGVGGSATTDGGAGMARALGARLLDDAGNELPPGGGPLTHLAHIEWQRPAALEGLDIVVATDVTSPLLGPDGAAAAYAPQKGANPAQVAQLEEALARFAAVVERDLGADVADLPGSGAAGGLAAGLVAFLGARVASGFEVVAEATQLTGRLAAADVVVTGEGSFDGQSLRGKTTGRVSEMARTFGRPCVVMAGHATATSAEAEVLTLASLEPRTETSMARAAGLLAELAEGWARERDED